MQAEVDAEVRRTLASYCQTVDDGRFDEFAELWSADAVVVVGDEEIRGRDAIRAWIERVMPADRRGRHVTVNTVVTVEATDRVRADSDFLFLAHDGQAGWRVTITGRYRDVLRPDDGRWVLVRREIHLPERMGGGPTAGA